MLTAPIQTFGEKFAECDVIGQAIEYPDGAREMAHVHFRAQLLYATRGIVRVITPFGLWMMTPGRALLIKSQVKHELHMVGAVAMRTLYIQPASLAEQKDECRLIAVDPLLHASILGLVERRSTDSTEDFTSRAALIVPLVLRLLREARDLEKSEAAVRLPLPVDMRLREICEKLMSEPASHETVERWAERISVSARTLARLFHQETGMTFSRWREQLRLAEAMSRLAIGQAIAQVAIDLGYADARTLAVMFKRAFGNTPQQFQRHAYS